jgi:hypothetical protein
MRRIAAIVTGLVLLIVLAWLLFGTREPQPGEAKDEAMLAGRKAASFPPSADGTLFRDMDNGITLSDDENRGRNMWLVWTGGNDRFWDQLIKDSFGTFDLLKTISSAPGLPFSRDNRWSYFGIVNEPCFEKPTGPDPKHFGLWLDQRKPGCGADPFDDAARYPGVKIRARGSAGLPVGSYYGEPTGIVGLRLFTNPDFDEEARKRWDPVRYYNDPSYYLQKDLVRPYRVGMACGFCHVGPSPIHPPKDPENPEWADLNSTVGAQYFWFDRVFVWSADQSNFVFQLLHSYLPGTLDTSLVSSDSIVNPRTMNAIYDVGSRIKQALPFGRELLAGGELANKQFNDFPPRGPLDALYARPYVYTPRVLKDGSDSVGALGALNRVYLNIGLFSEEWLLHFTPFIGIQRISPIRIADAERNSVYWLATEQQSIYMARFLVAAGRPDHLADVADGEGKAYLSTDETVLDHGKEVFADRCARCHSDTNHMPRPIVGMEGPGTESCNGPGYLQCWNRFWAWTKTEDFRSRMRAKVKDPDFLEGNYLSTEFRVPVTLLQTNACSPLARNALRNNIWDDFSSDSYKSLPSVGAVRVQNPLTGEDWAFTMPAGGRGYTRPPSLISLWSTAPFLQNNSIGPPKFNPDPSVGARMRVFEQSIEQLLWPEKRQRDSVLGDRGIGEIQRTTATSWIMLPVGFQPTAIKALRWVAPDLFDAQGNIKIGPIPKGTPVDLLGNFDPLAEDPGLLAGLGQDLRLLRLAARLRHDLSAMPAGIVEDRNALHAGTAGYSPSIATTAQSDGDADMVKAAAIFGPLAMELYGLGTCPDYVINRGHYFGTDLFAEEPPLGDADKRALIEFLKTF